MDFALRLAIANPAESADEILAQPALLLIDEVDLHLHPAWQQRVIPDLMRTFPGTQLVLTTHSPQVLSTVARESIRMLPLAAGTPEPGTPVYQTQGVASSSVLAQVQSVDPIPDIEAARKVVRYSALIEDG